MNEDKALLSEYLSEAEQLLDSLLADLDALSAQLPGPKRGLRKTPSDSLNSAGANLINRMFRTVHSLKGLSGMMGLVEVQSLTHDFEDILDDLRLGRLRLNLETATALQQVGAELSALVGGAARGSATEDDFARFQQSLAAVSARSRSRIKPNEGGAGTLGLSDNERKLLTQYEEHRISENRRAGRSFYSLGVELRLQEVESQYRLLTSKLDNLGELITALPGSSSIPDAVGFKLIFATNLKESEIKKALGRFQGKLEKMGRSPWRLAGEALKTVGRIPKKIPTPGASAGPGGKRSSERNAPASGEPRLAPPPIARLPHDSLQPLLSSVRIELGQIDELSGLAHELAIETELVTRVADRFVNEAGGSASERFDLKQRARRIERQFVELEERLVELRMVSLTQTFTRAARLAERLARELGKLISVEVSGRSTQVDKMIVEHIADPLHHVLRNAVDHGIETPDLRRLAGKSLRGRIKLEARLDGTRAIISVSDDGKGIDLEQVRQRALEIGAISSDDSLSDDEAVRLILRPGFSTAAEVSSVSGRGVGLDAVERTVHHLGGEIRIVSEKGKGTRFELAVPTTLQMISAFIVKASHWRYAVNVGQIVELLYLNADQIEGSRSATKSLVNGKPRALWRGSTVPLFQLNDLLGLNGELPGAFGPPISAENRKHRNGINQVAGPNGFRIPALITRVSDRPVAVAVEGFEGQREIIVKSLGSLGRRIKGVVGAVDLEGGDVALVIDLPSLVGNRQNRA